LCRSEYAALERVAERDEGIFDGSTTDPLLVDCGFRKNRTAISLSRGQPF
jgi:hypothetical protein